jgi:hypothetical protein
VRMRSAGLPEIRRRKKIKMMIPKKAITDCKNLMIIKRII